MEPIHFFRAGNHTSTNGVETNFSDQMLSAIAANYDRSLHEAPIVVGHPKGNAPAYGWVDKIITKPGGLYAVPREVNGDFADLVKSGAYKKVSGAFYAPDSKNHPKAGTYYLRHIGFLGAQPPALKGLDSIELSDESYALEFEEQTVDLREERLNAADREMGRKRNAAAVRFFNERGLLPIGEVEETIQFLDSLSNATLLNFADGEDGKSRNEGQAEWFLKFLERQPRPVVMGELVKPEGDEPPDFELRLPPGRQASGGEMELVRRAKEYAHDKKVSFEEAVKLIARTGSYD